MEKMTEVAIVNCIEKMMTERREKILESDEYIRQDVDDLKELEERYAGMNLPYMFRRVIDDYIACLDETGFPQLCQAPADLVPPHGGHLLAGCLCPGCPGTGRMSHK